MRIFVGNLSFQTTDTELETAFKPYGQVDSADVITDKFTQRSRGFGFVDMKNEEEAKAAINALNGKEFNGRQWNVNEARDRRESGGAAPRQQQRRSW